MIDVRVFTGRMGNQMFQYAYLYAQAMEGVIPDVYVQDPKYFEKYQHQIRKMFSQGIVPIDQVAIHVRRAANPLNPDEPEYFKNSFYVDLMETDYYEKAMAEFPGASFVVFSDDIEWCKLQRIFNGCSFSEGDELTDFNRMAGCKGLIMANSSFSWWAAFLSTGKIIAPSYDKWYCDGSETRTVVLPLWKQI